MYNMQFQHSPYSDHPSQYDIANVNAAVNNDNNKAGFPSPITTSSLDSPPNKMNINQYIPLPNSPKAYTTHNNNTNNTNNNNNNNTNNNNNRIQQYDMSSYIPAPANFTTDDNTPSPHQAYYGENNHDTLVSPTSPGSNIEEEIVQRNMQHIFEKKRRRRESHNAVERRRRDNINDRITELATLLPDRDAVKSNKGTILRKSVDHIRLLHDKLRQHQQRIGELENMLEVYRHQQQQQQHQQQHQTMIPPGHPLDLSGMQPHMANSHHAYRRDTTS